MNQVEQLRADLDRLTRQVGELSTGAGGQVSSLNVPTSVDPTPPLPQPPVPPSANQLRNGDFSHSVNTWHEAVAAPGTDKVLECAHWYSNNAPAAGQALSFVDARTNANNQTLKTPTHSTYNVAFCDWGLPAGIARMQGTKSLDAPFPNNSVFAGRPMYMGAIIARRNATISIADDCRIAAMLYDNNAQDFIKAGSAFHLSGSVRGVPAGTTERRYKVLAETDRGYSFLSDELVLAGAPNDASFVPGVDVFLSWEQIEGVLRYRIFRRNVVAGTYDELREITSGSNTYGDNNSILDAGVAGYPAASDDRVKCYVATLAGQLSNVAIDGVALKWDSLFLNIPVPGSLSASATGNQVFRLALTKALDRRMTDAVSVAASNSISSATGAFTAQDTGRMATLLDEDGNVVHGPEAITFVDATHVTFATNVASSEVNAVLFIEGGGDHGLLIDMLHIGYIPRSTYAPYFEDLNRTLFSTALPNSSSQGGIGSGGDNGDPGDGGIVGCVTMDTPITMLFGNHLIALPFEKAARGAVVTSGNHQPNVVLDIFWSETDNLHVVRTQNSMELKCSPGQKLFTSFVDHHGVSVNRLRVGDNVLTCADGRDEISPIIEIHATGKRATVGTFRLSPGHKFLAGRQKLSWWRKTIYRLMGWQGCSGIYCHNLKRFNPDQI